EALFMLLIDYGAVAAPAVPELIECLSDTNHNHRILAIQTLRGIGPPAKSAVPALEMALPGPNPDLVAEALWTIDRQTNIALQVLTRCVEDRWGAAANTLGALGPAGRPAVPALLAGLENKDVAVRIHSGRAIWKIAPEHLQRSLEAIIQPLTNGVYANPNNDWYTAEYARYAASVLRELGDDAI